MGLEQKGLVGRAATAAPENIKGAQGVGHRRFRSADEPFAIVIPALEFSVF